MVASVIFLYAYLFDGVGRGAKTSGVDKAEGDTMDVDEVFDSVAGGAMNIADDGFLLTDKGVEEGALSDIGLSDYGHGDALFHCLTRSEGVGKTGEMAVDVKCQLPQLSTIGKLEFLVVAEVEFEFD